MKFGIVQQEKFRADAGAYSLVTSREYDDSQITATDAETGLLESAFGKENILIGNVASNKDKAGKVFRLYPSGEKIVLNLIYPKPQKNELRLYLAKNRGFKPDPGKVWFLFTRGKDVWIGAMSEKEWRNENALAKDDDVLSLQTETDPDTILTTKWRRDRKIALKGMQRSKFKCEFDSRHDLFIARATGCPFLESHHLIPIRFQGSFSHKQLDSLNNLACLCPNCHRAIHHAEPDYVRNILCKLAELRSVERHYGLSHEDLYRLYAAEEIVR